MAAADVFPFAWTPVIQTPNPAFDVTSVYSLQNLSFICNDVERTVITDVMPVWIDEDGNEIPARSGSQNPNGWNPDEYTYSFDPADFKINGEYMLLFPEGLLTDAAGGRSDRREIPFSFDLQELTPPMFEDFEVLSVSPDFSEPQAIWSDQIVTINTNHNDAVGLVTLQLIDLTDGGSMAISTNYTTGRLLGNNSPITWEVVGEYMFYKDHEYRADFVFYNGRDQYTDTGEPVPVVDRASFIFKGDVEPYAYSPVTLLDVSPDPDSTLISTLSQAVFTYSFSGPVNVYKAETPMGSSGVMLFPQELLSSNDDKTVWTLNLSKSDFLLTQSSAVVINIYARDEDGLQLQGNEGNEENSCFQIEWECEVGASKVIVETPIAGASLTSFSEVIVRSADGKDLSWSWMGSATVSRSGDGVIGTLVYVDDASVSSRVIFSSWIPTGSTAAIPLDIKEPGDYTVAFSHGCFISGDQSSSRQSRSVSSSFRISDGKDNPPEVGFKVLSVVPDLSKPQQEWIDRKVVINTNSNDAVGLVTLKMLDVSSGEVMTNSSNYAVGREPGDPSEISWTVPGSYKFFEGHRYRVDFVFYGGRGEAGGPGTAPEVGRVSYYFDGELPDDTYSSESLVEVSPQPSSVVISDPETAVFTYVFSGPVSVYKVLATLPEGGQEEFPESCLSSSADKTAWTLDLSGNTYVRDLDGKLVISLFAKDLGGKPLQGNYGEKDESCFRYEWDCLLGARTVTVAQPLDDSVVESLTEVTVKSVDGLPISWAGGLASVLNADGSEIGQLGYVAVADVDASDAVRFAWWIPAGASELQPLCLEQKGEYSVAFATGTFLIGNVVDARRSLSVSSSFTVTGRLYSNLSLVGVSPEPMSEVISEPSRAVFTYTFSGPVNVYKAATPLGNGSEVEYPLSCLSSNEEKTTWTLDLSGEEYVLALDAPLVIDIYARDLDGYPVQGNFGEEEDSCFRYEWNCTIGALPEATDTFVWDSVDPESGATVTSLSLIKIVYPDVAIPVEDVVDVYAEDDVPVLSARIDTDPDDNRVILVSFPEPVTEDGVYSVVFREAMIADVAYVESEGKTGAFCPAFTLVYTVEREDDAVDALTVYSHGDVFDLHGRLVLRMADASRLKMLPKGIYIYNGEKLVIK